MFETHLVNYANYFKSYQRFAEVHAAGDRIAQYKLERDLLSRMTMVANLNITAAR